MNLDRATKIADKIKGELSPFCEQIEIAGSIRRRRPEVNDIDIVCLPRDPAGLRKRVLQSRPHIIAGGQWTLEVELAGGVRLDIWIAGHRDRDMFIGTGCAHNFGSLLLLRTGSIRHNIWLVHAAKSKGLTWNAQQGLYDGHGRCVASETESDIFAALGIAYINPEDRER
jgi:DNA polymerase (family 10)